MSSSESLYQIRLGKVSTQRHGSAPDAASGPGPLPEPTNTPALDRRGFVRLLGTGIVAGGACAREVPRKIVPYTRRPAELVPGVAEFYATSMVIDGYATGLLVESREGRPIKIEGNPDHPASLGAAGLFHQAAIRQLYDDQRGQQVRAGTEPLSWQRLLGLLAQPRTDQGRGLRILMEPTGSPLLVELLGRVQARYPLARFCLWSPLRPQHDMAGAALAFGRPLLPQIDVGRAQVVVAFDSDFLDQGAFSLRYARQWAARRRLEAPSGEMNRLYVIESLISVTGSMADHRLRRPSADILALARALAARVPGGAELGLPAQDANLDVESRAFIEALARDLRGRPPGSTLILVGDRQPPLVHALGYAINVVLGNLGGPLRFSPPVLAGAVGAAAPGPAPEKRGGAPPVDDPVAGLELLALPELVRQMRAGAVETLVMLETNPVYSAPADLEFSQALSQVASSIAFVYYQNETALASRTYAPTRHFLESWGDARAYDGTVSLIQPLIRPLVDGRSPAEVLAAIAGDVRADDQRMLRERWLLAGLSELELDRALQNGVVPDTALPTSVPDLEPAALRSALRAAPASSRGLALELYASPTLYDGRFANNPWLLEQPTPIAKLTWDNAAFLSPATARRLGFETGDRVELAAGAARAETAVLVVPGQADDTVAVYLGYGRLGQEKLARGAGFDAYPFRTMAAPYWRRDLKLERRPGQFVFARTQIHFDQHERPIALKTTLKEYRENPRFTAPYKGELPSLLPEFEQTGLQWAMSIDLSVCTGCSACMMACQAENNVMVVGRENVRNSREMHWLRIDTYHTGSLDDPGFVHQPMLCQHCEKAPCEYVCPVNATVHSDDGLNEMVYNRCVGTRFCSNNCPYKVRRFNYFDYGERNQANQGTVALQYNPEVTVRERGVMEKCTYCVQRIRRTEIDARLQGRPIRPGEVVTACQATCPTGAIQFGSLTHRQTPMVRWREQPRSYAVLHEEGTRPRTMYLARIDNPRGAR